MKLDLSKIEKIHFPEDQYYRVVYPKKQIYLHHTGSGKGEDGDLRHWLSDPSRIATCIIVAHDGIKQLYSSSYWGHHLGVKTHIFQTRGLPDMNIKLNRQSIAIEIDSWGSIFMKGENYYSGYGTKVPKEEVCELKSPFRTYGEAPKFREEGLVGKPCHLFQKYSDNQIEWTRQLLEFWNDKYGIPIEYKGIKIFDVCEEALKGEEGVWTHCSVRPDKSDIYPQPEIIQMLEGIKNK